MEYLEISGENNDATLIRESITTPLLLVLIKEFVN